MVTQQATQQMRIEHGAGIIAALDQSGGSIPVALGLYGVPSDRHSTADELLEQIHAMRARILRSPAFSSDHVIGTILFRESLAREINGKPIPRMLWEDRGIVPFLKIDDGLDARHNDVQLLKPIPDLDARLELARAAGIFGTKKRSVIHDANRAGVEAIVGQQFQLGRQILQAGLVPILEPEVSIVSDRKSEAEALLRDALQRHLDSLAPDQRVVLKLSLPNEDGFYDGIAAHPNVLRIAALSGGYSQDDACARLARHPRMIASFSRALVEGLSQQQTDAEFDQKLAATIARLKAPTAPLERRAP